MAKSLSLFSLLFASSVSAQNTDTDLNPGTGIASCSALNCTNDPSDSSGVCAPEPENGRVKGVGIVPDVFNISDAAISYTLIDGAPWGNTVDQPGYDFSTRTLYAGADSGTDLSSQPPGCALLLQYQGQTFPQYDDNPANTTSCPQSFAGVQDNTCLDTFVETVRGFEYDNNTDLPRCQALARYVQYNLTEGHCHFYGTLISVSGGAISGPDARTDQAHPAGEGDDVCQPVLPQRYGLHEVVSAEQILHSNASVAGTEDANMGGRAGYTPVVSVLYEDEDDQEPNVQFLCMQAYTSSGRQLPVSSLRVGQDENSASGIEASFWKAGVALLSSLAFVL
ncbi:hypothetical protein KC338_g5476 [Hortaea werneckii]|nr:hypothetical protein KC338_g5476 [Hortaea werneckii]